MVTAACGLTGEQLEAIAALEARVLAADGGRLKLEWQTLRSRSGSRADDFLVWTRDGARLLGFAGIYQFGGGPAEFTGLVDPEYRRRGIASSLLDAGAAECGRRGQRRLLLVVPRSPHAGGAFAVRHGGRLEHSEHAMLLSGVAANPAPRSGAEPVLGEGHQTPADHEQLRVRPSTRADLPALAEILTEAFGYILEDDRQEPAPQDHEQRLTIELDGAVVGGLRVRLDNDRGGVYGFAVACGHRGRGIGRAALRHACRELRERGAHEIALEVETANDHALGLYESLGFRRVATEDYYELSL